MSRTLDMNVSLTCLHAFKESQLLVDNNPQDNKLSIPRVNPSSYSILIDNLIDETSSRKHDARGGNSECFLFEDYALIKGRFNNNDLDELIIRLNVAKREGINVVPILGYKVDKCEEREYKLGYVLQERAKGKVVHESADYRYLNNATRGQKDEYMKIFIENYEKQIDTLLIAPKEHFEKFISDCLKLIDMRIQIDPSKTSNFFYDKENGFSFVDMCILKESLVERTKEYIAGWVFTVLLNNVTLWKVPEDKKDVFHSKLKELAIKISGSMRIVGIDNNTIERFTSQYRFMPNYKPKEYKEYKAPEEKTVQTGDVW